MGCRSQRLLALTFVVGSAWSTQGCGEDVSLPDNLVSESPHFEYYARDNDPAVCEQMTGVLERHRAAMSEYLKIVPPARTRYYKYRDASDIKGSRVCPRGTGWVPQCYDDNAVYAYDGFHQHELIHAYRDDVGRTALFLDEGLAEALSCGLRDEVREGESSVEELVSWKGDAAELYRTAQILVAHIISSYGLDAFWELFLRLRAGAPGEEVRAVVEDVLQRTLEDVLADARSSTGERGCLRAWECASEEWVPSELEGFVEVLQPCSVDEFRTFEVQEASVFVGDATWIGSCEGRLAPLSGRDVWRRVVVPLQPGRYVVGWPGVEYHQHNALYFGGLFPLRDVLPLRGENVSMALEFRDRLEVALHAEHVSFGEPRRVRLVKDWLLRLPEHTDVQLRAECSGVEVVQCGSAPDEKCVSLCDEAVLFLGDEVLLELRVVAPEERSPSVTIYRVMN